MSDLDDIRAWMHNGTVHPDRSGEIAALQAEVEMLRHEIMCVKFERSGLYAKLRDANSALSHATLLVTDQREVIEELRRLLAASAPAASSGE